MAEILNKDPATYQRERESFIRDLKHFHDVRGTPVRRLPFMNGKELDLYLLYLLVTAKGGWVKVNQRNEWGAVLNQFDSLNHCVNGEVALKQIYLRYLDRYEKINFLGETCERTVEEDEEGRHKRFSARISTNPVPHLYNYHQHIVPDNIRANGKLSQNLYIPSEYDKLALSLISPLPNEQDFAINVCALLSGANNEGKNTSLKLCNHPRLMHYLLAHAAVYNHHTLRTLMEENYKEIRGYSLKYFWSDVLEDKELSILMDEKKHVKRRLKPLDKPNSNDTASSSSDADENQKFNDDDVDCRLKLEPEDEELFCIGRSFGTQDFVGQRVLQVAMILRNATFLEENVPTLAGDSTFLRFVLLCCGSRWNCLHQLGFDMLSNVAHEVVLEDFLVEHLMRIICRGLESPDRTVILGCVETLNKLGQKEENEEIMLRCIEQKVYNRICSFLSLQDIMLLIHTLECLYSLSSLGEKACNSIVHVSGAIDSLISLVTVEAQSYGPKACILMRVVETVTGDLQDTESTSTFATPAAPAVSHSSGAVTCSTSVVSTSASNSSSFVLTSSAASSPLVTSVPSMVTSVSNTNTPIVSVSSLLQASVLPTPAVASPVVMPVPQQPLQPAPLPSPQQQSPQSQTIARPSTPQRGILPVTTTVALSTPSVQVTSNIVTSSTTVTSSVTPGAAGQHPSIVATQQENENFATQWLKNTFETHTQPGRGVEQNELYKLYMTACSRAGRRGVIAPKHFPQCVRTAFGNSVVLREIVPANSSGSSETSTSKLNMYEGLQVRAKPLNVTVAPSTLTQPARTPSSPILKAQLSSPSPPNITKKEVKSKVSSSHPHLSNVLLNAGNNPTSALPTLKPSLQSQTTVSLTTTTNDSSNSTSLIKSLLATKVGDFISSKPSVTVKNEKSVLPTPHQLVLNTAIAGQVTQRQQQQQLQQHKIVTQPHLQTISSSGETANIHILPQTADLSKQIVQLTQAGLQVIQAPQPQEQKPQIIQLTSATQQQLLQVPPSDKPQLVQISHPGGQQQLIQINAGQQQLLQICQPAGQPTTQPILQVCPIKQEQSVQTSDALQPQQVLLSQPGQQQQVIQLTPQLLPHLTSSVQQQILQASQVTQTRPVLTQQLLPEQGTQSIVQQTLPICDSGPQIAIVPQSIKQCQNAVTHVTQSNQVVMVPTLKSEQVIQSSTVSVITSTASANIKPMVSRINGMRSFTPVNVVVDDDKNDLTASLLADEKMESSPELPFSCNSNDSSDIPKQQNTTQIGSKVIVENHVGTSGASNTFSISSNKGPKLNDLEAELSESSSNQSLPVISIKDTESNLPACELGSEDSTGMFEDFLLNGKSNSTLDDSIANNLMSEDSLLNNIIMREELANNINLPESTTDNPIKIDNAANNGTTTSSNQNSKENNFVLGDTNAIKQEVNFVSQSNSLKNESSLPVMEHVDVQTKSCNNFTNILKCDLTKTDEKNITTKNLMLAELLEKNTEKKEPPILNGALRLGEKGLELIRKEELQSNFKPTFNEKSVICSNKKNFVTKNSIDVLPKPEIVITDSKPELITSAVANQRIIGIKRMNDQEIQCDTEVKKPHLNGDTTIKLNPGEEETPDETNVKASSSAANLYAALAADVLGDIDGMEEEETPAPVPTTSSITTFPTVTAVAASTPPVVESPSQQLYLTPGHNPRQQILLTTSQAGIAPRVSIMNAGGQQYIVTPQTAIVQGQPQTVFVTQTAQQHGTGAKTIIILQSQNPSSLTSQTVTTNPQPKVIMQKVSGTTPPIMSVSSAPVVVSTCVPNTIKTAQPMTKLLQANTQSQGTQISATQFISNQSIVSASSQTLPIATNQLANIFPKSSNVSQTQTTISAQCNAIAQTAVVTQMPQVTQVVTQVSNFVTPQTNTQTMATTMANSISQVQTQSPQCRQVKVIKTVPHLQPVIPNKMQSVTQQSLVTTHVPTTSVVPVVTTIATASAITAVAVTTVSTTTVSTPPSAVTPVKSIDQGQFLCEWRSCMRSFKTANEVYLHACAAHCPSGSQEIQCLWERCDAMKRKRFSLMTHLYDRHCNPEILKMMAVRRKQIYQSGRSEIPPPLPPTPHPGYAPNAALHAIKRHALEFVNPKELQDENEGPVTKSIRLTSSLILRNVVIYSTSGRRHLTNYEPHLASIALSNVESSRTIAQILFDMNDHNR